MALTLAQRCAKIELLVLDVDGVLTDGRIVYSDSGAECKRFHVRDGSGLKLWQAAGRQVAIISGRSSAAVDRRAEELGISAVAQGVPDKWVSFRRLLGERGLVEEQVCAVGDDVPDLALLTHCGLAVAVADACAEVRAAADYISKAPGGRGAVREVVELILCCQGHWAAVTERFRRPGSPR